MPDTNNTNVGQIVYNLKDYRNRYNYISTNGSNITQIVYSDSKAYNANCSIDPNSGASSSYKKIYIYDNFIGSDSSLGITQINKLGIQAPPGTRLYINGDKEIMVGRTGIYELDEDFKVEQLWFVRPRKYILDENQTKSALENGIKQLEEAKNNFDNAVSQIEAEYGTPEYWKEYNNCYNDYLREYQSAYALFLQGVNGIYIRPNSEDPSADENFEELENIIIDFLY